MTDPQADASKRMHVDRPVLVRRRGSPLDWDGKSFRKLDGRVGYQLGYSVGDFLRAQGVAVDDGSQRSYELAQKLITSIRTCWTPCCARGGVRAHRAQEFADDGELSDAHGQGAG